jgi:hypothetical protein
MAEGFSTDSTQGVMLVTLSSTQTGDVSLSDADGNTLLTYTAAKSYDCVIFSCSEIQTDSTYTVTAGTESTSVEMDSLVYGSGSGMGSMGGGGGFGQGGRDKGLGNSGATSGQDDTDGSTEMPEDMTPPTDGQMPDGTAPSGDGQMPDGSTFPSDGQMPDGTTFPSDGQMPDGTTFPSDGQMPDGTAPSSNEQSSDDSDTATSGQLPDA